MIFLENGERKINLVKTVILLLYTIVGTVFSGFVFLHNLSGKVNTLEKKVNYLYEVCEYEIQKKFNELELEILVLKKKQQQKNNKQ